MADTRSEPLSGTKVEGKREGERKEEGLALMSKKQMNRNLRSDESNGTSWNRTVGVLTIRQIAAEAEYRTNRLGTFGPASEVRRIDPKDWQPQKKL